MKNILLAAAAALSLLCSCSGGTRVVGLKAVTGQEPGAVDFSWKLSSTKKNIVQEAYMVTIVNPLTGEDVWSTGKVESQKSLHIPYSGKDLAHGERYLWWVRVWTNDGRVSTSDGESWFNGLAPEDWTAQWIGLDNVDVDSLKADDHRRTVLPARYLRKEFSADGGKIESATLYVCGLGSAYTYINGKRVGDDVFGTLPTTFWKSVQYSTYDVTRLVKKGTNAMGIELGNGRYFRMRSFRGDHRYGAPRAIAQLRVRFTDGSTQTFCTDSTWAITDKGPIRENNEFDGEVVDFREDLGAWTMTGYAEDSRWQKADVMAAPGGVLRAQMSPALKVHEQLNPVKVWKAADGRVLLDMGQNMVGWLKVTLKGQKDRTIKIRYAEVMDSDTTDQLYVANLRSALVRDLLTPAADGEFTWRPSFVYHGFRFAEITGLDYVPDASDLVGEVVYDGMETVGTFESSNEILNGIFHNAYWGIRGNYRGMPTDCPQRDERMGWLGDRATGCYGESYIFDNEQLYAKWMLDIEESMNDEGIISDVSPRYYSLHAGDVSWPLAYFNGIDMLCNKFGNTTVVRDRYASMRKWVLAEEAMFEDGLAVKDTYGDWCMPPESLELIHSKDPSRITPKVVISSSIFYDILLKMSRFASIAGHSADSAEYVSSAEALRARYNEKVLDRANGWYGNNTVTANLLGLDLGLAPDSLRNRLMDNIVDKTMNVWGGHVSAGVIGVQHLMRGLSRNGQADLAYSIASDDEYPSWGYMIRNGATTIWELWNGNTADPAMNSRNHVMLLGDLIVWFYEDLAGIRLGTWAGAGSATSGQHFELSPVFPTGLNHVAATYDSAFGLIGSDWTITPETGHLSWTVTIPANTTATVKVPARFSTTGEDWSCELGSGTYTVASR